MMPTAFGDYDFYYDFPLDALLKTKVFRESLVIQINEPKTWPKFLEKKYVVDVTTWNICKKLPLDKNRQLFCT